MFRYSPRRSRSRGFKVKHVLQLFLLVSVSIWLLYQIRHSREQKAEFDDSSARSAKEGIKLGRKDLLPRIDDTITKDDDRDNNIIVDHFKPEGTGSVEIKAGVGDGLAHALAHENHARGEVDSRWKPLYGKHEREDSAKEETEEGKEEETKEEETEETHEDKETEEGKEGGEENEGEENKEEGEAETEESENKSSDGNEDVHHKGDESESHNATTGNEHSQAENSHEFVQWSNTNSTEAYIHQDERARNMRETETETGTRSEGKRNRTTVSPARLLRRNNSTAIKRNATNLKSGNISPPRNMIARARALNSTLNRKEAETRKYNSSSTGKPLNPRGVANSTYPSRKFMFRRQSAAKSNASAETGKSADNAGESRTGSNTKNTTDNADKKQVESNDDDHHHHDKSSVSHERDESAGADDVQKLKEMVDYSSVIKKDYESPDKNKSASHHSDSHSQEDGEGDNGASDESSSETSNPQEEKDERPDLKTMTGSVAEGRSSQ